MIFKRAATLDGAQLNWLDYLLSLIAGVLAVLSAGFGLAVPEIGFFFAAIVLVGTCVSFAMQRVVPEKFSRLDGVLYAVVAIIVLFAAQGLNGMLPEEGFPRQLIVSGVLCWMISLGSFFLWRDVSIIFQAVPTIALFGLVGAWDTFATSTWYFFGFLLCFATLFARAHSRQMFSQARSSGFRKMSEIRTGPWRWMAGPEWALASAAAIVALSLLGAPVIQMSAQGVAGFVSIPTPQRRTNTPQASSFATTGGALALIGAGNPSLSNTPLMHVTMNGMHYLRTRTYVEYSGRGFQVVPEFATEQDYIAAALPGSEHPINVFPEEIKQPQLIDFKVDYLFRHEDSVPIPGELATLQNIRDFRIRQDGTVGLVNTVPTANASGQAKVSDGTTIPTEANTDIAAAYYNGGGTDPIPPRVRQLAEEITSGLKTDYEKAEAIRRAVSQRCLYNINVGPTPANTDPVENFLFETKEGFCDVFASSVVLMCRSVGLPTRYVIGYLPSSDPADRTEDGKIIIRDSDRHAWAEVFFKDHGWVIFDATEGATAVPGGERGASNEKVPLLEQLWFRIGLGVLGVACLALVGFWARAFYKSRERYVEPSQRELGKLYKSFVRLLENRTGKPRRPSQTPQEYVHAVSPFLDGTLEAVQKVNQHFVELFYTPAGPTPGALEAMRKSLANLRSVLKANKAPRRHKT